MTSQIDGSRDSSLTDLSSVENFKRALPGLLKKLEEKGGDAHVVKLLTESGALFKPEIYQLATPIFQFLSKNNPEALKKIIAPLRHL